MCVCLWFVCVVSSSRSDVFFCFYSDVFLVSRRGMEGFMDLGI